MNTQEYIEMNHSGLRNKGLGFFAQGETHSYKNTDITDSSPEYSLKGDARCLNEVAKAECESNSSIESSLYDMDLKSKGTQSKLFICPIQDCQKEYSNKCRLEIHVRTHTGEKPFICGICEKSFNEKGNLKIHLRIHTGEKPYVCNFPGCDKSFKAYGHLSDHTKRHFNIKPYVCEVCNSAFSRRNTLKTHYLIHTGEKPHQCTFDGCTKRFSEKGNMKTHLKTHYKNKGKGSYILDSSMKHSNLGGNISYLSNGRRSSELSVTRPIEYNYNANRKPSVVNIETFLGAKRHASQTSVKNLLMVDQDGCTPKNQSFLINFNGIFDDHHRGNKFVDEIWEKYMRNDDEYVFNWFKQ